VYVIDSSHKNATLWNGLVVSDVGKPRPQQRKMVFSHQIYTVHRARNDVFPQCTTVHNSSQGKL